jgi:hypothetical protein
MGHQKVTLASKSLITSEYLLDDLISRSANPIYVTHQRTPFHSQINSSMENGSSTTDQPISSTDRQPGTWLKILSNPENSADNATTRHAENKESTEFPPLPSPVSEL